MTQASVVGIRAHWQCATCGLRTDTHQFEKVDVPLKLLPPENWKVVDRRSYCGNHIVEAQANGGLFLVPKLA